MTYLFMASPRTVIVATRPARPHFTSLTTSKNAVCPPERSGLWLITKRRGRRTIARFVKAVQKLVRSSVPQISVSTRRSLGRRYSATMKLAAMVSPVLMINKAASLIPCTSFHI